MPVRVTRKLVAGITCVILVVLGANAIVRLRREINLFEEDIRKDTLLLGRAVAGAAGTVWREVGQDEALGLVRDANMRESDMTIRWVWLDGPVDEPRYRPVIAPELIQHPRDRDELVFRARPPGRDDDAVIVYARADIPGPRRGAVELQESLGPERHYIRDSIVQAVTTTTVLALVCGGVVSLLGMVLVGRPVRKLVDHARRVGSGDLTSEIALRQRDEIGELGAEMNAMTRRLAEARDQLETESAARIAMVEQLRHADRLTTVGKLAAGLAHELGTPLNVITGHAQLIVDDTPDPGARDNATIVIQQANRVTGIVRHLLDFARSRKPTKERTELDAVSRQVTTMLEPMARKHAIAIALEVPPLEAEVDPTQLQQVLANLVVNAIQALPRGGTLTIGGARGDDDVRLWVRDDGPGIPPEVVPRIFEPFFTTKDIGEGTGLGLSVAYGIIREHGGRIDVDTEPGRGSTFTIVIPRSP